MYKSEIRPSQINALNDKARALNYEKYLSRVELIKCRAFSNTSIKFDFPVTALIGPNGGGKTTILGACALLYNSIQPRQFFTRNKQLDRDMQNWSISYDVIDRVKSKNALIKRTASFSKEKWYRDTLERNILFFGVSRTLPAVERRELSKFTNKNVVFKENEINALNINIANQIKIVLGKDVSAFSLIKPDKYGNITLLAGKTSDGVSYSEFHFGAGESSIIKMIVGIENAPAQSLILIEEIENGLHPVATQRLVEYLIDAADRKHIQVIFTTHSEYAIAPLPTNAVWAALDGNAIQGKLDIKSLRTITGEINSKLVIYVEDEFAKMWVSSMLRSDTKIAIDAIEIYAMNGDATAVSTSKHHNADPSTKTKSICIIDGDSKQQENEEERIFRLPGEMPELYIFDKICDVIEKNSARLAMRCMRKYDDADFVKNTIIDIGKTNRDPHLLFSQIGERIGFINENVVREAFLSTWTEIYAENTSSFLEKIYRFLPLFENNE